MYAKTTLIGTIQDIKNKKENGGWIKLKISRPFPDDKHITHTDYVWAKIWTEYFFSLKDYLFNGQLILVEGRLESTNINNNLGNYVFAERIEKLTHK